MQQGWAQPGILAATATGGWFSLPARSPRVFPASPEAGPGKANLPDPRHCHCPELSPVPAQPDQRKTQALFIPGTAGTLARAGEEQGMGKEGPGKGETCH